MLNIVETLTSNFFILYLSTGPAIDVQDDLTWLGMGAVVAGASRPAPDPPFDHKTAKLSCFEGFLV
jgi:hypothetical protein